MTERDVLVQEYLMEIYDRNPYVKLLQMSIADLGNETVKMTMPVIEGTHTNLYNAAHGGALASLADTTMGLACATTGKKVVTLDMNMNFIRAAVPQEAISAVGRIVHNGSSTMVAETDIVDGMGNLILKARGTFYVIGDVLQERS